MRAQSHINHESEAWTSHQVARRSVLIVNELGYEMRLSGAWNYIGTGNFYHVAGEL